MLSALSDKPERVLTLNEVQSRGMGRATAHLLIQPLDLVSPLEWQPSEGATLEPSLFVIDELARQPFRLVQTFARCPPTKPYLFSLRASSLSPQTMHPDFTGFLYERAQPNLPIPDEDLYLNNIVEALGESDSTKDMETLIMMALMAEQAGVFPSRELKIGLNSAQSSAII